MFLLGERDVRRALSLQECLDINRKALMAITDKTAFVPSRLGMPYPHNPNIPLSSTTAQSFASSSTPAAAEDWTLIKPAAYYGTEREPIGKTVDGDEDTRGEGVAMGMKVVGVRAQNPERGLPLVPATILLLDAATGMVDATIAGTYVTVARTSAGPGLAVKAFQPDAQHLVLFGAGAQAECHVEIMQIALQRRIPKVTIINRSRERAEALRNKLLSNQTTNCDELAALNAGSGDQEVEVVQLSDQESVLAALATADVVATTTNTMTPLWEEDGTLLKNGCLVTGIGSYTGNMQEVPRATVDRSHVIIDTPEAMQVGDLKHLGTLEATNHPVALAGDAFRDPNSIGAATDCIFYKAVGTAIQDVLTARSVVERAKRLNIGQYVDMD